MGKRSAGFIISLVVLSAVPSAWATMENFKSYKEAHPGLAPAASSCKICHLGPMGKKDNLNSYGKALKAFKADQGAKQLTAKDYEAFDAADSDSDGATNAQEITAGTDPFDRASVPNGAPVVSTDTSHLPSKTQP